MKNLFAVVLSMITLGLAQEASANFDHSLYARFRYPEQVSCSRGGSNPHNTFEVRYGQDVVSITENLSYEQVAVLTARCKAAVFQAQESGNLIYINLTDGTVMPDNGFFVQQPQ